MMAGITPRQRYVALLGLYASIFAFSISFGGLVPWMALDLEHRQVSASLIGLVAAAHPLGVMLMAPFTQRIVRRFGSGNAMILCTLAAIATLLPLASWNSVYAWLALRFISGLSGSVPWVVTETWINVASTDRNRGRAVAIYSAVMAGGFATGPLMLQWADALAVSPLPWFICLQVVSLAIIMPLRRLAPVLEHKGGSGIIGVFRVLPALLSAAFVSGALDSTFFSFLAIWGHRVGLSDDFALTLLSIFIAGNVLLQFPIGWLADRLGPRPVLIGCGMACIAAPLLVLAGLPAIPVLLGIVAFLWGGCVWGTYSVALVAMGRRFTGGELVNINAAFVMVYTFANMVTPPISGFAMEDIWNPHALMAVALLVASGFTLLAFLRRKEF
jgi:MFS family permease